MNESPKICVLVPVWNAERTLPACLRSIARQALDAWECVIIDDGSTDGTRAIAREAAGRDSRFRVISLPHGGIVPALNEGIRQCGAPLIARMDSDDIMHRQRLGTQAAALEADPTLSAVGCHVRLFPRAVLSPRLREYEAWLNGLRSAGDVARDAFIECPIAHPSLMMRREMALLGYHDRGWPEDYDLILRALGSGLRVGMTPRRLLAWRVRADSLSRTDHRYGNEQFTACKAHYLAAGFLSGVDHYILWGYGDTGRLLRQALAVHGKTPSHIVEVKTTRIGERIHGAPVIPVEELPVVEKRPIVVSVARDGPRCEIREAMARMGFVEGKDYVCGA